MTRGESRRVWAAIAATATVLALAACGSSDGSNAEPATSTASQSSASSATTEEASLLPASKFNEQEWTELAATVYGLADTINNASPEVVFAGNGDPEHTIADLDDQEQTRDYLSRQIDEIGCPAADEWRAVAEQINPIAYTLTYYDAPDDSAKARIFVKVIEVADGPAAFNALKAYVQQSQAQNCLLDDVTPSGMGFGSGIRADRLEPVDDRIESKLIIDSDLGGDYVRDGMWIVRQVDNWLTFTVTPTTQWAKPDTIRVADLALQEQLLALTHNG